MVDKNAPDDETPDGALAPTESLDGDSAGWASSTVLGGRYRVLGRLGRGGMGEVWRAVDLKLRVEVALKSVRAEYLRDARRLRRSWTSSSRPAC